MSVSFVSPSQFMEAPVVAKKKSEKTGRPSVGEPLNFRAPPDLVRRISWVAEAFALDVSSMVRLILAQNISTYEKQAEQILKDREKSPSN